MKNCYNYSAAFISKNKTKKINSNSSILKIYKHSKMKNLPNRASLTVQTLEIKTSISLYVRLRIKTMKIKAIN